jgi:hypothetical protein
MRFKLCTLKNYDGEKKTAYVKEIDAEVDKVIIVENNEWSIIDVSTTSITKDTLRGMENTIKTDYRK